MKFICIHNTKLFLHLTAFNPPENAFSVNYQQWNWFKCSWIIRLKASDRDDKTSLPMMCTKPVRSTSRKYWIPDHIKRITLIDALNNPSLNVDLCVQHIEFLNLKDTQHQQVSELCSKNFILAFIIGSINARVLFWNRHLWLISTWVELSLQITISSCLCVSWIRFKLLKHSGFSSWTLFCQIWQYCVNLG